MNICRRHSLRLNKLLSLVRFTQTTEFQPCSQCAALPSPMCINNSPSLTSTCARSCTSATKFKLIAQPLKHRGLVRVAGSDATDFLQGLITNDIQHLGNRSCNSMYTLMLNVQGRVLYDMIIYNTGRDSEQPCYLLECDHQVTSDLLKLMKRYKIRKKVDLSDVQGEVSVWSVFPEEASVKLDQNPEGIAFSAQSGILVTSADPRIKTFGQRLLLTEKGSIHEDIEVCEDETHYHQRRYLWGIGEGIDDLPPGNCLPLESNLVFLNGVSFTKGCYIGQELTARTYHTGVTRKHLMPVFIQSKSSDLTAGDTIEDTVGKNCGKFRSAMGSYGLALLRISNVVGKKNLCVKNEDGKVVAEVSTNFPEWWPRDGDEELKKALAQLDTQALN